MADGEASREENFIHMRGDPFSPEGRIVRARMRKRFYWEYPEWKRDVPRQGLEAVDHSLTALAASPPSSSPR